MDETLARKVGNTLSSVYGDSLVKEIEIEILKSRSYEGKKEHFNELLVISDVAALVISTIGVAHQIFTHQKGKKSKDKKSHLKDQVLEVTELKGDISELDVEKVSEAVVSELEDMN